MNRKPARMYPDNFNIPHRNQPSTSASSASVRQSEVDLRERNWQPVVLIDVDSCTIPPALNIQRTNDRQQNLASNNDALLPMPMNHPDERHATISDVEEAIPPTILTPELIGLRQTTSSSVADPNNSNLNMPIPPIRGAVNADIRSRKRPALRQRVPRNSSVPVCTAPVLPRNTVRIAPVSGRNTGRTLPVSGRNTGRTSPISGRNTGRTSSVSNRNTGRTSPVSNRNTGRTSPVSGRNTGRTSSVSNRNTGRTSPVSNPNTGRTSPLPAATSRESTHNRCNTRTRQIKEPFYMKNFTTLSETSSMSNYESFNNDDADYEPSVVSSNSSEYIIKRKPKAAKRKNIGKVKPVVSINTRKRKIDNVSQNETLVTAGNNDFDGFSSTSSAGPFQDFTCPELNFDYDNEDTLLDLFPRIEPFLNTARWVDSIQQIESYTEVTDAAPTTSTTSGDLLTVEEGGALTDPRNVVSTAPAIRTLSASESCSRVISKENKSEASTSSFFKLPNLPVIRTKHNTLIKNCPSRLVHDLQGLLAIQPDTLAIPLCKACKRCDLLTKYNKIYTILPVSDGKDILKRTPLDVYDFDSDEEGLQFQKRGRDLVCEVLNTKSFPIWLSNFEMILKKTILIDEHERGTLETNVIFDNNDASDTVVCKLITRIQYLDSCIKEDTKELNAKQFRRKLRSTTRSQKKNPPQKRAGMKTFRGKRSCPTLVSPPPVSSLGPPPVSPLPNILPLSQPEDTDDSYLSPHTEEPSNKGPEPSMEGHSAPVPNLMPIRQPEDTDDSHVTPHTEEPSNKCPEPSMEGHSAPVPNLMPIRQPEDTDDSHVTPHTEEPSNKEPEPSMEGHSAPVPNLIPIRQPEDTDDSHVTPQTEEPSNQGLEPSMEGHSAPVPNLLPLCQPEDTDDTEDTDDSHVAPHTEEPSNQGLEPSMEGHSAPVPNLLPLCQPEDTDDTEDTDDSHVAPHTEEPSNQGLEPSMEGHSAPVPNLLPICHPEVTYRSHVTPHTEQPSNNANFTSRLTGQPKPNQTAGPVSNEEGVYRPTLEQFKDPMAYIESIQGEASKYGIIKIIPPKGHEVPYNLNPEIIFSTKKQYPSRLYQRWGTSSRQMTVMQAYGSVLAGSSENAPQCNEIAMIEGMEIDLPKLYELVMENGGIEELTNNPDKWCLVAEHLGLAWFRYLSVIPQLKLIYDKHVLPYANLSYYERNKFVERVDQVWNSRSNKALRRASRPLHHQKKMLGETLSDDDDDEEEFPLDPKMDQVRVLAKPIFERAEKCMVNGPNMDISTFLWIEDQLLRIYAANEPKPCPFDCEKSYWFILLASLGGFHVSVYTAFIDTSLHETGHLSDPSAPGGSHPWNLKRLSENPSNVLSSLGKTPQVTVPEITLSQTSSCTCWQTDPHRLILVDCMHEGASKMWYGVAERDGAQFRNAMSRLAPHFVLNKYFWLPKDSAMVLPGSLIGNQVNVHSLEQIPGDIIIVFPGTFFSTISNGISTSESVRVQSMQWLHDVDVIFQRMRNDCEPSLFSNIDLLLRLAINPNVSEEILPQIQHSIGSLIEDEFQARREAIKLNCIIYINERNDANDEEKCSICHASLIFSKMVHYKDYSIPMCLSHGLRVYSIAPVEEYGGLGPPVTLLYSNERLHEITWTLKKRIIDAMKPHTMDASGKLAPPA